MSTGYITVKVFTAEKAMPVPKAQIRIIDLRIALDQTIYADENGNAERIKVYAPDKATSLKPQDVSQPYETYNIEIMKEGYIPTVINHVPVFAGETCLQPVAMIPQPEGQNFANLVNNIEIPSNGLQLKTEKKPSVLVPGSQTQLKQVFIPKFIRVHLGEPDSDDKTVLVPFSDYVKNVVSSEIYATWPKESLIANILAVISFALNRIYTGYYTAQGKDFDITSAPDRDPLFVDGRNIYANISELVDEVFNRYIKRTGFNEPLLANYCNGITTRCEGISQWGSVTLANQGQSAEDIVKYYYGNVQTETSKDIHGVEKDFPGDLLRLGDIGENVMTLQKQLNLIRKTYGDIPAIPKENGNYDAYTQDAVRAFQKQFNLHPDGIVGKKTWYQIQFIHNSVKRLQDLSRMRREITVPSTAPTSTLRQGSTGNDVRLLQYLLSAAGVFYNSILPVDINGNYDQTTEKAIRSFQKTFALPQTGVADQTVWNALLNVYRGIDKQVGSILDSMQSSGAERRETEDRRMQAPGTAGTEPSRPRAPERGPGDMARSRRTDESEGRRPGRDESRSATEERGPGDMMRGRRADEGEGRRPDRDESRGATDERIRAAMNYANMDYKPQRSAMNMAYSSEIKDYVPETGNTGPEPWIRRYQEQDIEKAKTEPGPKTGARMDQMRTREPSRMGDTDQKKEMGFESQRFQYTPWMIDFETPPARMDRRQMQPGSQDMGGRGMMDGMDMSGRDMMGGMDMGGMDMGREQQSGPQGRPGKPWAAMDENMAMRTPGSMDQGQPLPYIPSMPEDETMFTRPGTKVTPGRPEPDTGFWGTEPPAGEDMQMQTRSAWMYQQEEQERQARQTFPMRMPGTPGQARPEPDGDDAEEAYTCPDPPMADSVYPNTVLKIGSKGKSVQLMQEYLSYIALSLIRYNLITNELKVIVNDGIYGIDTTDAVIRFQNRYEMPVNGVIDAATWAKIIEVYNNPCE